MYMCICLTVIAYNDQSESRPPRLESKVRAWSDLICQSVSLVINIRQVEVAGVSPFKSTREAKKRSGLATYLLERDHVTNA